MSFWKSFLQLLGITKTPPREPIPVAVKAPEPPRPSKTELLKQDVATLIREFTPLLGYVPRINHGPYYQRQHHVFDLNYFDQAFLDIIHQPDGYYACELKLIVRYEMTREAWVHQLSYSSHGSQMSHDDIWYNGDCNVLFDEFLARCPANVTTTRPVNTPLFGQFTHPMNNVVIQRFFIGDLPAVETIEGDYTPENHDILWEKQTVLRDRYRDFAIGYLKRLVMADMEELMTQLVARLVNANTLQLTPKDTFSDEFQHSSLLLNYALDGRQCLTVSVMSDYGQDTNISAIARAIWTPQDYQAVYQTLFADAVAGRLAQYPSRDCRWEFKVRDLLTGLGDDRFGRMRFWLQTTG